MNRTRWSQLMHALGFTDNQQVFEWLTASYNEPHRKYHNEQHIDAVLVNLDKARELAVDPVLIELALWFHDAVYKVFSKTNEIDSAKWASEFVLKNNADKSLSQKVYSMIIATQHNSVLQDSDEQLMVDIDLSILGASETDYDEFEQSIRKEYRLIPWPVYKRKRTEILNGFLERKNVYSHEYFIDTLESGARANLGNAIERLQNT